jgi:phosphosulfolactate synthase (CoM biosynthesis protein A)
MVDFTLTDEQKALRELAHDFAAKEIRPVAWDYDRDGTWPQEIIEKAHEIGLMNVHVADEYGGPGLSYLDGCVIEEEIAWSCSGIVGYAINLARRCLDADAYMIMVESEGITEGVTTWQTDVVATIARELGLEKVMFEAADPEVFGWYIKNYGPQINLFVDHSQIVQLECLRRGIWGTKSLWVRVITYPGG